MTRHSCLDDLTRDHAIQVAHAKRLSASLLTNPQDALKAARGYLAYHAASIGDHFEEEELHLLPHVDHAIAGRFRRSQELLRNATDEVRITMMDPQFFRGGVQRVAAALIEHASFCEANLLPDANANLEGEPMEAMAKRMVEFRRRVRPTSIGANRTEPDFLG